VQGGDSVSHFAQLEALTTGCADAPSPAASARAPAHRGMIDTISPGSRDDC